MNMLDKITMLMLEKKRRWLYVDELFDDPDIGDAVRSLELDSPYQILLNKNVLTEFMREGFLVVSFSFEAFFHYKLGQIILGIIEDNHLQGLTELCAENEFDGFLEAVTEALVVCVSGKDAEVIFEIIDSNLPSAIKVRPFSYYLVYNGPAKGLSGLLTRETKYDYQILRETLLDLARLQSSELCEDLATSYLLWPAREQSFKTKEGFWLLVECLNYCDEKTLLDYQSVLISRLEDLCDQESENQIDLRLRIHAICADRGSFDLASMFLSIDQICMLEPLQLMPAYYGIIYRLLETSNFDEASRIYEQFADKLGDDGIFLSTSGWIFQVIYESGFGNISNLKKGLGLYRSAAELIAKKFGPHSFEYAKNTENIGWAKFLEGNFESAEKHLLECLAIYERLYGSHLNYISGNPSEMMASVCVAKSEFLRALEWLDRSDRCKLIWLDSENVEMAWNHMTRGECHEARGELVQARISFETAERLRERLLGADNHLTIESRNAIERVS